MKPISSASSKVGSNLLHRGSTFINRHQTITPSKIHEHCKSAIEASGLKSGDTLLSGGFGNCGIPSGCLAAIRDLGNQTINSLTVVSECCGFKDGGNATLIGTQQSTYILFLFNKYSFLWFMIIRFVSFQFSFPSTVSCAVTVCREQTN